MSLFQNAIIVLQYAQKLNIGEEEEESDDVYQEEIKFDELCPHCHNSVDEILGTPLFIVKLAPIAHWQLNQSVGQALLTVDEASGRNGCSYGIG